MRAGRLILVVATLVTILVFPVLIRDALQSLRLPNAYAAAGMLDAGGRVYQNGNNDDGDNDNNNDGSDNGEDDSDNEGEEDNGNYECYANLNDNEPVPCDDDNGNYDDNVDYVPATNDNDYYAPPPPAAPAAPSAPSGAGPAASRCFAAGESGDVMLMLPGGNVVIRVVPQAPFPQGATVQLDAVDPATVPAPPAGTTLFDTMVWRLSGSIPCGGSAVGQLPGAVNLGIPLNIPADKSRLQVVMLSGNAWVDVPTVPDPNPSTAYISATVQQTGVYAVIQR